MELQLQNRKTSLFEAPDEEEDDVPNHISRPPGNPSTSGLAITSQMLTQALNSSLNPGKISYLIENFLNL